VNDVAKLNIDSQMIKQEKLEENNETIEQINLRFFLSFKNTFLLLLF
jgi:hypothetical protein